MSPVHGEPERVLQEIGQSIMSMARDYPCASAPSKDKVYTDARRMHRLLHRNFAYLPDLFQAQGICLRVSSSLLS